MIVPEYWAESRIQKRFPDRQITVRRFGWSDESAEAAKEHADTRVADAFERIVAGQDLRRREPKIAYNGADGVPIREQIIARYGETVITRNSYGAECLNTPNVLFADVDFESETPGRLIFLTGVIVIIAASVLAFSMSSWKVFVAGIVIAVVASLSIAGFIHRIIIAATGGHEKRALTKIRAWSDAHPDWSMRVYRTPAGYRILVMHQTFEPRAELVSEFFDALAVDPIYARMCRVQNCFRARVSPKPWRMGISKHMPPRPGVWPVREEKRPARERWISAYEKAARGFASCRFVEALGGSGVDRNADAVRRVHDERCNSSSDRQIA